MEKIVNNIFKFLGMIALAIFGILFIKKQGAGDVEKKIQESNDHIENLSTAGAVNLANDIIKRNSGGKR